MSGYWTNLVTVTVDEFEKASPQRLGWDSKQLDAVKVALALFWNQPGPSGHNDLKIVVTNWKTLKSKEFNNRDRLSGGVCTRLYDDLQHAARQRGVRSVILYGQKRPAANGFPKPRVQSEDLNVVPLMIHADASGQGLGVLVIDLYGTDLRSQGLDRRYDGGSCAAIIAYVLRTSGTFLTSRERRSCRL